MKSLPKGFVLSVLVATASAAFADPTPAPAQDAASQASDTREAQKKFLKTAYVADVTIAFKPGHRIARKANFPAQRVKALSDAAGLKLTAPRSNGSAIDANNKLESLVFDFPRKLTEAEARQVCDRLAKVEGVLWCQPGYVGFGQSPSAPNDPLYTSGSQWNLRADNPGGMDAASAWLASTGSNKVVVAIVDMGNRPHTDLNAARILPGYDFIADTVRANDGGGRDADATDPGSSGGGCRSTWHGLKVTGILAATSDNNFGVAGIDQAAKILPVRVIGRCNEVLAVDLVPALRWAAGIAVDGVPANPNPAKVINLSLGFDSPCSVYPAIQAAIDDVRKKGAVVVVAAGNDDGISASQMTPASCSGVITVGSVTRVGGRGTSTTGPAIDISAPGSAVMDVAADTVRVLSDGGVTSPINDNSVASGLGTSFAAPHVSGTASLMKAVRPKITPDQIKLMMKKSAKAFPTGTGRDCTTSTCGAGILNGSAVVAAAKAKLKGGTYHSVSLKQDGNVYAWGYNGNGQVPGLALGTFVNTPTQISGVSNVQDVAAGDYHAAALRPDGTVATWGYNAVGQLGNGTTTDANAPTTVSGLSNVVAVAAGTYHTLALKADGTVWAWGRNYHAQLGNATFTDSKVPVQVLGDQDLAPGSVLNNVVAIAAGGSASYALLADGTVRRWGSAGWYDSVDKRCYATLTAWQPVPGLSNIVAIAAGGVEDAGGAHDHFMALDSSGKVYTSGGSDAIERGLLGRTADLSTNDAGVYCVPHVVPTLSNIVSIDANLRYSAAVDASGQVWTWGTRLDQASLPVNNTPTVLSTLPNGAMEVSGGSSWLFALNADLTTNAWGNNTSGQLGVGNYTTQTAPSLIKGVGGTGTYSFNPIGTSVQTDVDVNISASATQVDAGQNVTYTVSIINLGTTAAQNARAVLSLPSNATYVSATSGCAYAAASATVVCTVTSLGANSNANFQIVVKSPTAGGSYPVVASVNFAGVDSAPGNNVAGQQLLVTGPNDGDVPLPAWGIGLLGAALMGMVRKANKRATVQV